MGDTGKNIDQLEIMRSLWSHLHFGLFFFVSEKNYPQLIPLEDNFNRRVFIKLFIESNWSFILSCRTNNEHFNCIEFLGEGREKGQEKILWSLGKKLFAYFVEILIHFKCSKKKRKETLIFEESEYSRIEMDDLFVNFQNKIRYTVTCTSLSAWLYYPYCEWRKKIC